MRNDAAWLASVFDEHSRDLLLITTLQGQVLAANQRCRKLLISPDRDLSDHQLGEMMSKVTFGGQNISQQVNLSDMPGYFHGDELVVLKSHEDRIFYGSCRSHPKKWRETDIVIHSISPLVIDPFEFARQRASVSLPDTTLHSPPFLLEVAHEIKNTLQVILGLLGQSSSSGDHKAVPGWQQHLSRAAESLTHLAHDMGDISRLQRGDFSLHCRDFDLLEAFESLMSGYRSTLQGQVTRLIFEPKLSFSRVHGDKQRILQIARNLLDNALRFTAEGVISLQLQLDAVGPPSKRLHLRLRVQDSGVGLPEGFYIGQPSAAHPPHHQVPRSPAGSFGIGLTLCERLCHLMDGKISAHNAPTGGAVFEVSLVLAPAAEQRPTQHDAPTDSIPRPRDSSGDALIGKRILLVDDAAHSNEMTAQWLREVGAQPTLCSDGQSAWQHLRDAPFDLVLMDASLPRWSGAETTRAIRQLPGADQGGTGQVPIIGLTGQVDPRVIQDLRHSGMNEVLSKPISRADLLQALEAHLDNAERSP
ncbi:response regulator [Curvibacter sp. HBC61]|uniref:histidine kinase n=1 Tax=Curvibacter cyanobacteriorum TaxID=3026422 RepID=A0ABT5N527_9BURK|nr:response regulator [Curvibacter sp. HBC61]MDD0840761.1 response regulator [Curvibacter sp. HBC61]